jgi:phosphoenolpyruvate carboxylase
MNCGICDFLTIGLVKINLNARIFKDYFFSTQPLTEMSTRNLPGGKKRPARRADNLAAIYEPNV